MSWFLTMATAAGFLLPPSLRKTNAFEIHFFFSNVHPPFLCFNNSVCFHIGKRTNEMHKIPLFLYSLWLFTLDCKRLSKFTKIDFCHLSNLISTNLLHLNNNLLRHSKIINTENSLCRGSVYLPIHISHSEEISSL